MAYGYIVHLLIVAIQMVGGGQWVHIIMIMFD